MSLRRLRWQNGNPINTVSVDVRLATTHRLPATDTALATHHCEKALKKMPLHCSAHRQSVHNHSQPIYRATLVSVPTSREKSFMLTTLHPHKEAL